MMFDKTLTGKSYILIARRPKAYFFGTRLHRSAGKTVHRTLFLIRDPLGFDSPSYIKQQNTPSLRMRCLSLGGAYRTAPELTSRGTNFRFVRTWTDWAWQPATGGGEGSRTPVRKPIQTDVSERRRSSTFPHTKAGRHAYVLSSR